ncbi:Pet127-domain-containing protein [Lindgomyces ingoldianus]|uniref:Pet127-domain-containing protein n=1 Tax=Lindgomyces ingoldianus TaxID=673940 RepID=A0ACB6R4J4_9PLEO|nr:Pet127-domain-containing protein [Lindgomyces ingoldianus]KAF2474106.1 Pet127-domain-containing protein [Lindgomyces ingoldianus]
MSLKEALLGSKSKRKTRKKKELTENLEIEMLSPEELQFQPVEVNIPPVPMLSHGLDRVLFNPGIYRLQDPRSRVYNFDPYLEKIMPAAEFNFDALSEYKTSSKDEDLLAITRDLGTKFTGSTSSMSGTLTHFHYLLSGWRPLCVDGLSKKFPSATTRFSKIQRAPNAIFLRKKNDVYAIDADKSYDSPNIMSWLGHSLEKLLTNSPEEFELYRRSSPGTPPNEDDEGKSFHYSKLGNFLMRSQLDAYDPRLPGTGVFDLKTRAVVTIRMNHKEYEMGSGYQLHYDQGEWESYEREFYDMTRATLLKYSLQVRMGRMDGIFVAYHNIERIFGFQYISLPDMDYVLHGQTDTCLGDQEFKLSIRLLDELLGRATQKFPETSIRLHFETRESEVPYMYVFAEPVTEEAADMIQNSGRAAMKDFERNVIGVKRDDPEVQKEWQEIQDRVDEEVDEDQLNPKDEGDEEIAEKQAKDRDETDEENTEGDASKETASISMEDTVDSGDTKATKPATASKSVSDGPLMGWTLTVRNLVNGRYVKRPEELSSSDSWSIEYHVQELPDETKWSVYGQLKTRRKKLIGLREEEQSKQLKQYREMLQRYSDKGRKWREEQDKIDEQMGKRVYRRLGPGAEEVIQTHSEQVKDKVDGVLSTQLETAG